MRIFNGTVHEINLYDKNDVITAQDGRKLILKEGAQLLLRLEAGTNLNASKGNAELPKHLEESNLPLKGRVIFLEHDPVPSGYEIVVVSNLYRSAVKELGGDTSALATVDGVVYKFEFDLRPCGCLNLAVG